MTGHARDRAWERYGMALTDGDMTEIIRACQDGRAQRMQISEHGEVFVWRFKGKVIIPVLKQNRTILVTFNPPDHFTARVQKQRRITKTTPGAPHYVRRPYKRRSTNRAALRKALDDA